MAEISEMVSQNGKYLLVCDGYKYRLKHKSKDGWDRWCCVNKHCASKLYRPTGSTSVEDIDLTRSHMVHNHDRYSASTLTRQLVTNNLKRKLMDDEDLRRQRPRNILRLEDDALLQMTPKDIALIRRSMYNAKKAASTTQHPKTDSHAGQNADKSTGHDVETPSSEVSDNSASHPGEDEPRLAQQFLVPRPGPSASMQVTQAGVEMLSPPTELPNSSSKIPRSTSVSKLASEVKRKRGRPRTSVEATGEDRSQCKRTRNEDKNCINGALQKIDEVCDILSPLSREEDSFDHFGRYVASVLRSLPSQKASAVQKKFIDLISQTQSGPVHKIKDSSELTENPCDELFNVQTEPSNTVQEHPLPVARSLAMTVLPIHSTGVPPDTTTPKSQPTVTSESSTNVSTSGSDRVPPSNDDFILNKTFVDGALKKLDEVSEKLAQIEDGFDHFGAYLAYHLRRLPLQTTCVLQKKVIDLILKCQVESTLSITS